jgi:hypothetical protein
MDADCQETRNQWLEKPEIVTGLETLLDGYIQADRSNSTSP